MRIKILLYILILLPSIAFADTKSDLIQLWVDSKSLSAAEKENQVNNFLGKLQDTKDFEDALYTAEDLFGEPSSPYKDGNLLVGFLSYASSSPLLDEAQQQRAAFLLEMALKNFPGSRAADFNFLLADGSESSLHALPEDSKYLLIFYDPNCFDCHTVFDDIQKNPLPKGVKVLAMDAEYDLELWKQSAESLPKEWTVGFVTDPIEDDDIYVIQSTPAIYLLAPDKTVILKDASLPEVRDALK